jgi:hypothetical protein
VISFLLLILGEGATKIRETLSTEALPHLLTHPSHSIRNAVALCFRCLAVALPAFLAITLNECITKVTSEHAGLALATTPEKLKQVSYIIR